MPFPICTGEKFNAGQRILKIPATAQSHGQVSFHALLIFITNKYKLICNKFTYKVLIIG